jgi:hypothetical protein
LTTDREANGVSSAFFIFGSIDQREKAARRKTRGFASLTDKKSPV